MKHTCNAADGSLRCLACAAGEPPPAPFTIDGIEPPGRPNVIRADDQTALVVANLERKNEVLRAEVQALRVKIDRARTERSEIIEQRQEARRGRDVLAAKIEAMEADRPDVVMVTKKPALRPHTIPGWWQVWSGYLCIALLTPSDVEPLLGDAAKRVEAAELAARGKGRR